MNVYIRVSTRADSGCKESSFLRRCLMLSSILFAAASVLSSSAAEIQLINGITPNPNGVGFYAYVPANLAMPPPLIIALHDCNGTAITYYTNTQYAALADQHGFIVIYPNCAFQTLII